MLLKSNFIGSLKASRILSVAPCCRGNENKILMFLRVCVCVSASEGWVVGVEGDTKELL